MKLTRTWVLLALFSSCVGAILLNACNDNGDDVLTGTAESVASGSGVDLTTSAVPAGPAAGSSDTVLYRFAWQEFVALNWPVDSPIAAGGRGIPNTDASATFLSVVPGNSPTLVWTTYASKAEMFGPAYQQDVGGLPAWSTLSLPVYSYRYPAAEKGSYRYDLFNNLDENNEIGQAFLWGGGGLGNTTGGKQILYEAKVNETEYEYIRKYNLQDSSIAAAWSSKTKVNLIPVSTSDTTYGGTCLTDKAATDSVICFPCADNSGSQGVIEIKAAWRELINGRDSLDHYFRRDVIVYKYINDTVYYTNKTYGLIALHIIRKTENYPTFIFATFNQVDNIRTGIYYQNNKGNQGKPQFYKNKKKFLDTIPKYNESGTVAVKHQDTIHAIPSALQTFNSTVQKEIAAASPNSVWQYYELLGVQGDPHHYSDKDSDPSYFLANDVVETDYTLRRFSGAFGPMGGIELTTQNIHKPGQTFIMGGCQGCHGNAQLGGTDFSFLLNGGVLGKPDTLGTSQELLQTRLTGIIERVQ